MKIIPVALTGAFLFTLTAGIFIQTGFSIDYDQAGCHREKWLPQSASPYTRQVVCEWEKTYENGTTIVTKRVLYWCYGGNIYGGITSGTCIVYQPGGKETSTITGNPTISNPMKNQTNELKQLIPTEPGSNNPSTESNQPKQLVPLTPPDDTVSGKGVGGDSDNKKSTDTDQLKQILPTEPQQDNPATEKGGSDDKGTESNDG